MNNKITLTNKDGHTGTATVKWFDADKWNVGGYKAFICVPFKNAKWESLFVYDKENLLEAIEEAKMFLMSELDICTLV